MTKTVKCSSNTKKLIESMALKNNCTMYNIVDKAVIFYNNRRIAYDKLVNNVSEMQNLIEVYNNLLPKDFVKRMKALLDKRLENENTF